MVTRTKVEVPFRPSSSLSLPSFPFPFRDLPPHFGGLTMPLSLPACYQRLWPDACFQGRPKRRGWQWPFRSRFGFISFCSECTRYGIWLHNVGRKRSAIWSARADMGREMMLPTWNLKGSARFSKSGRRFQESCSIRLTAFAFLHHPAHSKQQFLRHTRFW